MALIFKRAVIGVMFFMATLTLAVAGTVHLKLSGSQEVPVVKTSAYGAGSITVAADGAVSGQVRVKGVKATMAHIHQGAAGSNGPVIIVLRRGPHGTWVVPHGAKLTPAQYKKFEAGDLYVNVHSAKHPGGEIRGQLKP